MSMEYFVISHFHVINNDKIIEMLIINPRSQTGLSEQSPAGPQLELVANKDSEDADGTCYRRVNHNDDSLDNDSEDLDK